MKKYKAQEISEEKKELEYRNTQRNKEKEFQKNQKEKESKMKKEERENTRFFFLLLEKSAMPSFMRICLYIL